MYIKNNKIPIIILGTSGFVGSYLLDHFKKNKKFNTVGFTFEDIDLTNRKEFRILDSIIEKSIVVFTSSITRDRDDSVDSMLKNIKMVLNLCDYIKNKKVRHIIYFSSAAIYGNGEAIVTEETKFTPVDFYAKSKIIGEELLKETCFDYNVSLTILRMDGIYGPNDTHKSPIQSFIESVYKNETIKLYGDGTELRDFIYIEDFSLIVNEIITKDITGIYNIASGKSFSILEILFLLSEITSKEIRIVYLKRTKPTINLIFDNSLFRKHFSNIKLTNLKDGLIKTCKVYSKK